LRRRLRHRTDGTSRPGGRAITGEDDRAQSGERQTKREHALTCELFHRQILAHHVPVISA
jgi:hypothetical protein